MTVHLFGIDFEDDEVQYMIINGRPEVVLNAAGVRRMAAHTGRSEVGEQIIRGEYPGVRSRRFRDGDDAA